MKKIIGLSLLAALFATSTASAEDNTAIWVEHFIAIDTCKSILEEKYPETFAAVGESAEIGAMIVTLKAAIEQDADLAEKVRL